MTQDLFKRINNAVLDMQAADTQSFERPLRTLVRLLADAGLQEINAGLTAAVDLDKFLSDSDKSARGIGGGTLTWPDDSEHQMGLVLLLLAKLAEDASFRLNFSHTYFASRSKSVATGINSMTSQMIVPFARDYKEYVLRAIQPVAAPEVSRTMPTGNKKVFVVHGHDAEAREMVARFLERLGLEAIILHEQVNRGMTVIEKVEHFGDVGFAVVLLTPDDVGRSKDASDIEPRARQNVLLELGYFIARLTRRNVCALKRGHVEIPSDFAGIIWQDMDSSGGWKLALGKELRAAGYEIDFHRI